MSSTHTNSNQQRFMHAAQLEDMLVGRALERGAGKAPFVIGIAGGSASGKTTVASRLRDRFGSDQAVLFSQDLFQLGSDFAGRKTSPYKWDDPDNFDLPACRQALEDLRTGRNAVAPNFDVVANVRRGVVVVLAKPIIVWEGVYALLTPELRQLVDLSVFVDAPYMLRLLRRISRFLGREAIDDISAPARQMLSFVLRADIDFVATQKAAADSVLEIGPEPADIQNEVALFKRRAARHAALMAPVGRQDPLKAVSYAGLSFELYEKAFVIADDAGQTLYAAELDAEIAAAAQAALPSI